jgi:hypothetical protein
MYLAKEKGKNRCEVYGLGKPALRSGWGRVRT